MVSIKEQLSEIVKEKQRDKDFKDTSVVEYTRKFQAQYDIITFKDLDDIEKDFIAETTPNYYSVIPNSHPYRFYINLHKIALFCQIMENAYLTNKVTNRISIKYGTN